MTIGELTEHALIARIQQRLPPAPDWMAVGIGDDAAALAPERGRLQVLTVDALVDGVHFDRRFTPPAAVGHRALAANLSDLAAMGADPRVVLLSLVLPTTLPVADFDAMIGGITALAAAHRVHVAGGNLTASPGPLVIDITAVGSTKPRQLLTRAGARPGDEIYVTGAIGGSAAGLEALQRGETAPSPDLDACIRRYLSPEPRVRMGQIVGRNRAAVSCTDLSDGLGAGVVHLTQGSGVGAIIDGDALPIEPGARAWFTNRGEDLFDRALCSDDYELVLVVRPRLRGRLRAAIRHGGAALTRIGVCTEAPDLVLRSTAGGTTVLRPLPRGYHHFR